MRDLFPVLRVLGMLMCMFALAMALPGAVSWWQQESVWRVYPLSMAVTMGAGLLLWWLLRHHRQELQPRHGVILVTLVWVLLPLAASLPLWLAMAQVANGVAILGVGELGIGNTTPAAAMVSVLTGTKPEQVVGLGANYPSDRLHHKIAVVEQAIACNRPDPNDGLDVLAKVGGFDLVGMTGVMLGGAAAGVPIVLDGFLSYACALVACRIAPQVWHYLLPSHLSAEKGSCVALAHMDLKPFLQLDMRLGEGSGAAIAMQIIDAAHSMYNRMGKLVDDNLALPVPS